MILLMVRKIQVKNLFLLLLLLILLQYEDILQVHKVDIHLIIKHNNHFRIKQMLEEIRHLLIKHKEGILQTHKTDIHITTKRTQEEHILQMHRILIRSNRIIKILIRIRNLIQPLDLLEMLLRQKVFT